MPSDERGPGIFISEMFFFYCMVRPMNPTRILESGRDLGGSTLLLANCFPEARIISVEFEASSPRAEVALKRLRLTRMLNLSSAIHAKCCVDYSNQAIPS